MNKNEIFCLWISDDDEMVLPILPYLSLKSMILCGHEVILYTYSYITNVPDGVKIVDANEIIDKSLVFKYETGHKTFSGFANLFRLKRLYEFGGTWVDLDTILIRNINDKFNEDVIICSEPSKTIYLHPNNALLRFPKHDPFVKEMLDFAEKKGSKIVHGETGPKLIFQMLRSSFPDYNQYLNHFNFNNILGWSDIQDYSKPPIELLNKINTDEIVGFHLFNTFFKNIINSFDSGLFYLLKCCILYSNSPEEYNFYLNKYKIISKGSEEFLDELKNWDLKYLTILKCNNVNIHYDFTILIDTRNLKKVEIYNILNSINNTAFNVQVILFGRNNISNDKIELNENIFLCVTEFNKISNDIYEYIFGNYIMPINSPIMFSFDFFKNIIFNSNIKQYLTNKPGIFINIIPKKIFKLLLDIESIDIFNFSEDIPKKLGLKVDVIDHNLIYDYENRSEKIIHLINLIDKLNEDCNVFQYVKYELTNLKFENLFNKVSYYHYTSYENILISNDFNEFQQNENNSNLNCLISFYLNKLNGKS